MDGFFSLVFLLPLDFFGCTSSGGGSFCNCSMGLSSAGDVEGVGVGEEGNGSTGVCSLGLDIGVGGAVVGAGLVSRGLDEADGGAD